MVTIYFTQITVHASEQEYPKINCSDHKKGTLIGIREDAFLLALLFIYVGTNDS